MDALSPVAAQGQLGLGGTSYASNNNNQYPAAASFRQGFLRYHFTRDRNVLRVGRFEFFDEQETTPKDSSLLWLQTNRIAQRLVGNFGFSNGQRSFDGVDAKIGGKGWDLTAMAGRATQGVYNMNANPELNVDIQYMAYSHSYRHPRPHLCPGTAARLDPGGLRRPRSAHFSRSCPPSASWFPRPAADRRRLL